MSNGLQKHSLRQQAKGALNRVEALEQGFARALVGIEKRFGEQQRVMNQYGKIIEGLVESIGPEAVQEIVNRRAEEEAQALETRERAALSQAISDGVVSTGDKIGSNSLIIGNEVDGEGKPVGTGRQQIAFRGVDPRFQMELEGKGVGHVIKTASGGTFEVTEVYEIDEVKAKEVMEARQQAAAAASAEAAGTAAAADEAADTASEEVEVSEQA